MTDLNLKQLRELCDLHSDGDCHGCLPDQCDPDEALDASDGQLPALLDLVDELGEALESVITTCSWVADEVGLSTREKPVVAKAVDTLNKLKKARG